MFNHQSSVGDSQRPRRQNIVLLFDSKNHTANDAREVVDVCEEYSEDDVLKSQSEDAHEHHRDDEVGERPLDVDVSHDDHVHPTTIVGSQDAQRNPDEACQCQSEQPHDHRYTGAGYEAT